VSPLGTLWLVPASQARWSSIPRDTDEAGAASRVDVALGAMATTTCRVGEGVVVTRVSVQGGEVEVSVKARPRVSLVPPALRGVVIPELERTSSARMRGL